MDLQELNFRKSEFARKLIKDFQPNYNHELLIIEFPDFPPLTFDEKLKPFYRQPGIYGIHCFATNRTFIYESLNVLTRMAIDYDQLNNGFFESPEKLQKDFDDYPFTYFVFILFTAGPEWKDYSKRLQERDRVRNMWPYDLYLQGD